MIAAKLVGLLIWVVGGFYLIYQMYRALGVHDAEAIEGLDRLTAELFGGKPRGHMEVHVPKTAWGRRIFGTSKEYILPPVENSGPPPEGMIIQF